LTATGFRGAPRFTVSLLEKNCMSNSFPKQNLPLRVATSSDADRRLTLKIQEAGQIVEISLLDHVIVGAAEAGCAPYFSFKEAGLL
jgi:DNA repair protein RadC